MLKEIKTRYVRHAQILLKIKGPVCLKCVRQEENENNCAVSTIVYIN